MKVQLILGSAGTGKSSFLYRSVCREAAACPENTYLLIVPEQFTLETQRELVLEQAGNVILNIDVLSFLRLALRVFDELGLKELPVLDDMGKNMVLRRVLSECRDSLHFFRGDSKKLGFLSELKSLLSEFEQYGVGEQELEEMIAEAGLRPMLEGKLKDAQKIMKAFREFKREKFLTAEEILVRLTECVGRSEMIRDSVICFDGFTGFTPVQVEALRKIFFCAKEVRVTVTMDRREDPAREGEEFELFSMSQKMISQLRRLAVETGNEWEIIYPQKGEIPYRFQRAPELAHLEKMLFRYPNRPYEKTPERIALSAAENREEELRQVLKKIKTFVRKGYRYRDIAVLTGDIAGYAEISSYCFKKEGIPFFMDYKKNILSNPYVEFLRSFLAMFDRGWSYEAVFRHLGNGLLPLTKEEKDRLENYVLATGIRGYASWKKVWEKAYSKEAEEQLPELNELRERLIELIAPSAGQIMKKKSTVLDYVLALYEYSRAVCAEKQLRGYERFFRENGEHGLEREYAQVYPKVMELLERMAELLGEEEVSLKEFMELFDAGIAEVKIGLIPPGLDQVIIGDLERTRLNHVKILFFIGLNDGIVPKTGGKGGILSDLEREYLSSRKFELAPTQRQLSYRGQYYLYLALTKPDSYLYLSYCRMNPECEPMRPSYLLHKITALFPGLEKETGAGDDLGEFSFLKGLRSFQGWEKQPPLWKALFYHYAGQGKEQLADFLSCAFGGGKGGQLPSRVAKLLYGNDLIGGVTRFEKYAACQYAHFLAYGLRLKERQEFVLRSVDIGNVFHEALRIFGEKASSGEQGWHGLQEGEAARLADESLEEALGNGSVPGAHALLVSSFRNQHLLKRMKAMMARTAEILVYQVQEGHMEPAGYELNFSRMDLSSTGFALSETENMKLLGQIDRLDSSAEAPFYVRIVDYKTGKKEFSLSDVYYGLQMQLMVYLSAGIEIAGKTEERTIAGGYYYRIGDPFIKKKNPQEEDRRRMLKLDGISNGSIEALLRQDKKLVDNGELVPSMRSDVIPCSISSKGEIDRRLSDVAEEKELAALTGYVQGKLKEIGKGILDGKSERNPYQKSGEDTACLYCSFREMCSPKDTAQPGGFRRLSKEEVPEDILSWGEEET